MIGIDVDHNLNILADRGRLLRVEVVLGTGGVSSDSGHLIRYWSIENLLRIFEFCSVKFSAAR